MIVIIDESISLGAMLNGSRIDCDNDWRFDKGRDKIGKLESKGETY